MELRKSDEPADVLALSARDSVDATATDSDWSDSFDVFYARELPALIALARGLCGAAIAEDVAQEAMLAAYRRWREVGRSGYPEAWVRRVCANIAVSQFRRRAIEARALLTLLTRQVTQLEPSHEEFWSQVRTLPRRQAQAIALRYVYDLKVADIAATLQCSEGSVKVHLSRARLAVAKQLHVDVSDEESEEAL